MESVMDSDLVRVVLTFRDEQQEDFEAAAVELGFEIFESCPKPEGLGWIAVNVTSREVEPVVHRFRELGMEFHVETAPVPHFEHLWQGLDEPVLIGEKLAIAPPGAWDLTARRIITINPELSFGGGSHATTQMLLEWLEAETPQRSLLDVGCGTGVLALAAKALGTRRVVGFDSDGAAVKVARRNGAENQLEVEWLHARLPELSGRFECVVANLLATILMDEWEGLRTKVEPGGQLLVSGILEEQAMGFLHAVGDTPLETKSRDGWVAMRFSF